MKEGEVLHGKGAEEGPGVDIKDEGNAVWTVSGLETPLQEERCNDSF